ncbi:hypothetical protein HZS_2299 [Henneguya salminicola]|nr:hypothetical protein HZS_2299 [Henneguya salminicola]
MYNCNGLRQGTVIYVTCIYAYLRERMSLLEYNWSPKLITAHFEMTPIKTIRYEFPDLKLHGCYFDCMNLFIES